MSAPLLPILAIVSVVLCLAHFGKGEYTHMEAPTGTAMLFNASNMEGLAYGNSFQGNVSVQQNPRHYTDYNTSCPSRFYNEKFHVDNVVELDVDMNVVRALRADYEADFEPHLGYSTTDICLKVPYDSDADEWFHRSDIKWYAPRTLAMYQKYLKHVEELGILDYFKGNWIDADEVKVYQMQFVVRSHIEEISFHLDWQEHVCTQLVTFLIPINDMNIHLVYKDNDERIQQYQYKLEKGIGFAGGFNHSTNAGHSDTPDVLFSVELGGIDPKIWDSWLYFGGHAYEYYMHPTKGFIENERFGTGDICEPTKEESDKGDDDEEGSEESEDENEGDDWNEEGEDDNEGDDWNEEGEDDNEGDDWNEENEDDNEGDDWNEENEDDNEGDDCYGENYLNDLAAREPSLK